MNAKRILYLGMLCLMAIMTSCSNDDEEFLDNSKPPVFAEIMLIDDDGNNLLTESTIYEARNKITVIHDESRYIIDIQQGINPTPFVQSRQKADGGYTFYWIICMGDVVDKKYIIDYGNGTQDVLEFTVKYYNGISCSVKINGEEQQDVDFLWDIVTLKLNPNR